jgi:hypothetical protein
MAKLTGQQIRDLGKSLVIDSISGIRYSELIQKIATDHPETPRNTIHGNVWDLDARFPTVIHKPSRGLFVPVQNASSPQITAITVPTARGVKEKDFYEPFAEWLKNELDEVTVSSHLGGAGLQKKWGTPDVVGVYKPLASHRIKFDLEIVSAEIKIDPSQSVIAFGQAVAYRLFSAKSYIVMPNSISPEDYGRLEALCLLFGIGLVIFGLNPQDPSFSIRVRAQRVPPDMFYVNEFADRLYQIEPHTFNHLFG